MIRTLPGELSLELLERLVEHERQELLERALRDLGLDAEQASLERLQGWPCSPRASSG